MDLHKPVNLENKVPWITFSIPYLLVLLQSVEELTPEEKWRLEHQKLHEQHKGHEKMHAEMVLILILTLVVAQVVLIEWKKRHSRSYLVEAII